MATLDKCPTLTVTTCVLSHAALQSVSINATDVELSEMKREIERERDRQTYEWNVVHGVDDDALVLLSVLGDASKTRLHYVIAVEELLFR